MGGPQHRPPRIAMIAGEASGDHLGASLLDAIAHARPGAEAFGVGGPEMQGRGFDTCFAMSEIAIMGPIAIALSLRTLARRVFEAVEAVVTGKPDVLVLIDCPEFSHRVATRVRRRLPDLPIIDYVAPSIWAWRPGRARRMLRYVDEVMALLPFEPDVFERLGGPPCRYVGHPAAERLRPDEEILARVRNAIAAGGRPVLAVMPGSRNNELKRLCGPFSKAVGILAKSDPPPALVTPTLPHLRDRLERESAGWAIKPLIVSDPDERHAAMVLADAAIVASGTATLELAIARTPMVVGYRAEWVASAFRWLVTVHSIVLANLVHGGTPIVELFQGECTGERLAREVAPLLRDSEARRQQLAALDLIRQKVIGDGMSPGERAARIVVEAAERGRSAV